MHSGKGPDQILEAILPPDLSEGTPTSFAIAGHLGQITQNLPNLPSEKLGLAHVNLKEEYLEYKNIIGQVILDVGFRQYSFWCGFVLNISQKNLNIKTVVNKLNNIHTQFRFFEMELLAGVPEYIVTVVRRLHSELLARAYDSKE